MNNAHALEQARGRGGEGWEDVHLSTYEQSNSCVVPRTPATEMQAKHAHPTLQAIESPNLHVYDIPGTRTCQLSRFS